MSQTKLAFWKRHVPWNPWAYFGIFLAALTLLSYSPVPKLWVGIYGLFLPLSIGLQSVWEQRHRQTPSPQSNELFKSPIWLWVLFFLLFLFTHFYRLTTLPFWPLSDEGIETFIGMNLSKHWSWNLLWTQVRVEPLMYWTLGLYFKLIPPSLFSIRLFSTIVSLLTVISAYWAARLFFSRSLSFLIAWMTAFSFWDFTLSRFCSLVILVPLLEYLCFGCLNRFLIARSHFLKWRNLVILGILGGIGFYSWTNWAAVWLCLLVVLIVNSWRQKSMRLAFPIIFVVLSVSLALPLVWARLAPGEMTQIHSLSGWAFWKTLPLYIESLFWNGSASFPFGSNWGGFLNPILGALILTGTLHLLRTASKPVLHVTIICLWLAVLPGIAANGVEIYRVLPVFPFLMVLATLGFSALIGLGSSTPIPHYRPLSSSRHTLRLGLVFLLVLGGSFGLDIYNYIYHYCSLVNVPSERQWRNFQYYDAYKILSDLNRQEGPLYVFDEFNTDYDNKTLEIACYPFNAIRHPSLSSTPPQWTVLIGNIQYAPYLIKRFPNLRLKVLRTDKEGRDDPKPFAIFLIRTSQIPESMLDHWKKADEIYQTIDFEIKNKRPIDLWESFLESHSASCNQFPEDRFLTAIFWEKMGFFKFVDGHFVQAAKAYQTAINQGIPAAHLYYALGFCLKIMNKTEEADKNFEKARLLSMKTL